MDKRGFNKMFLIVIAVAIVVVLIIYITVTPRNAASLAQLNQQQTNQSGQQNKTDPILTTEKVSQDDSKPETQQSEPLSEDIIMQLKEELKPHKYHSDPYIEAHSIMSENATCFAVSNSNEGETHIKKNYIANNKLAEFEAMMNNCQAVLQSYPTLADNVENIYWNLPPNSQVGHNLQNMFQQQLKGASSKDTNSQTLIAVLKSKNGPLIAEQSSMGFMYFSDGEFMPFSAWLKSRNFHSIEQIFQLSLAKIACHYQAGIACEPQGMTMLTLCSLDNAACGLDFKSYYQQNILPGMQKDVDILVEKFEAMAE